MYKTLVAVEFYVNYSAAKKQKTHLFVQVL